MQITYIKFVGLEAEDWGSVHLDPSIADDRVSSIGV